MPSGLDGHPDPLRSPQRACVLDEVADEVLRRRGSQPVTRVGVDGIDGAGKSTLADELAAVLRSRDVLVVRATTDSFHNPRAVRWARGPLSPEGFYRDSHDLDRLQALLLTPISADPPQPHRNAAFDEPSDTPVEVEAQTATPGTVLVFDGLFLHRPELRGWWDLSLWVDGARRVTDQRIARALPTIGPGPAGLISLAWWCAVLDRYVGGMRLYQEQCRPEQRADAVVGNDDLLAPTLTWRSGPSYR